MREYEKNQDILFDGYHYDYENLVSHMSEDIPDSISMFVYDVLQLYRCLNYSFKELKEEDKLKINSNRLKYKGFDGNEEAEYYLYAKFVLKVNKEFEEIYNEGKAELNSHRNMVGIYQYMLDVWKEQHERYDCDLSVDEIIEIVEAPYQNK